MGTWLLGGTTCSTGEDTQGEDAHLGNSLLVFMAGQRKVFLFLSLFDLPSSKIK